MLQYFLARNQKCDKNTLMILSPGKIYGSQATTQKRLLKVTQAYKLQSNEVAAALPGNIILDSVPVPLQGVFRASQVSSFIKWEAIHRTTQYAKYNQSNQQFIRKAIEISLFSSSLNIFLSL